MINDETLNFELSPHDSSTVHVLHNIDDAGSKMFGDDWTDSFLSF